MNCTHLGPFRDGVLTCDRTSAHDEDAETGHTYAASWAPDGTHDDNPTDY